jgi:phosphatidylglycerophosphate synthase
MRVREGISELRAICQEGSPGVAAQPWAFLQIRKISIFLTWMLLHFPLSANAVSLAGIAAGLVASVLLGSTHFVAGAIALQLAALFDFSDGEVSRYRKQQSKQGSYLDKVYHFTVPPSVFAGITIGAYQIRPSLWILVVGFISSISAAVFLMVMAYANELAIWKHSRKLVDKLNAALNADQTQTGSLTDFLKPATIMDVPHSGGALGDVKQSKLARRVAELSSLWDFPYTFFVITAAVVSQALFPLVSVGNIAVTPLELLLLFYGCTYPCWIGLYLFYVLSTRATERGYLAFVDELSPLLSRRAATNPANSGVQ